MYFDIVFGLFVDNSGEVGLNRKYKDIFWEKRDFLFYSNK